MRLCIHTGSYSIDNHSHTQAQTDAMVSAIVGAIPNCTHIAIGTYLDYDSEFTKWATSIHTAGKSMWVRSAGYNEWSGTNGVGAINTSTALSNHRTNVQTFISNNRAIFQSGDIFEATPDEPENGAYLTTLTISSGAGQTTYNGFITGSITDCDTAFASAGVTGVKTNIVGTSPSASRNAITSATANVLDTMLIDAYPEHTSRNTFGDPFEFLRATKEHIDNWVTGSQGGKIYHYTMGPSIYIQLESGVQKNAFNQELFALQKGISSLDGITVWQSGGTGNPLSRLFNYNSGDGSWTARSATAILNQYFQALLLSSNPFKRLPA